MTTTRLHAPATLRVWMGNRPRASFRVKARGLEILGSTKLDGGGRRLEAVVADFELVAIAFSGKRSNAFLLLEPGDRERVHWFQGFGVRGPFRIIEKITDPELASLRFRAFQPV